MEIPYFPTCQVRVVRFLDRIVRVCYKYLCQYITVYMIYIYIFAMVGIYILMAIFRRPSCQAQFLRRVSVAAQGLQHSSQHGQAAQGGGDLRNADVMVILW